MRFASASSLVVLLAASSSCVVINEKGATLQIDLSFDGSATCDDAGVTTLRVSSPLGDFDTQTRECSNVIALSPLAPGDYRVKIEALTSGTVLYQSTVDATVKPGGTTEISVDLTATGNHVGTDNMVADFIFGAPNNASTMPPGMTCAEAGVQSVSVVIDSGSPLVAKCHDTGSNRDAALVPITAGTHTFVWSAFSGPEGTGTKLYTNTFPNLQVSANSEVLFNMAGVSNGGLEVDWHFPGGQTCQAAGVDRVHYMITDALGENTLATDTLGCTMAGFIYDLSPGITAGVYKVYLTALDTNGGTLFSANNVRVYAPAGASETFDITLQ